MTNITESPIYEPVVYQIATIDPLLGGPVALSGGNPVAGYLNTSAQQLANRTAYLKSHIDSLESGSVIPPGVAPLNNPVFTGTVGGLSKNMVGLSNVDNTSDILKPVSNPTQTALNSKADLLSPSLSGTPTSPTAAAGTSTTQIASTAFVTTAVNLKANIASPNFTGTPLSTTPAVGTNTTQIATTAMLQLEFANKRTWTNFTPTITSVSGTFTSITATGRYLVVFGICYLQVLITVTTKGTGVRPIFTLPFPALSSSQGYPLMAREGALTGKTGAARIISALTGAETSDYTGTGDLATADGAILYINGAYPVA